MHKGLFNQPHVNKGSSKPSSSFSPPPFPAFTHQSKDFHPRTAHEHAGAAVAAVVLEEHALAGAVASVHGADLLVGLADCATDAGGENMRGAGYIHTN